MEQIVRLHRSAPAKPPLGAPCNGCGVCCAAETCALGRVVFLRKRGPCPALAWDDAAGRYWCGLVKSPPRRLAWLAPLFTRWIAAGMACDSSAVVEEAEE
jgi:hypothetical protein